MSTAHSVTDSTTTRDTSGRFVPGCSGNPAGKKPGTQNWATRLRRALKDGADDAITRQIVERPLKRSGVDGRFVDDPVAPQPGAPPGGVPNAPSTPGGPVPGGNHPHAPGRPRPH